jgi:8-amino-7-oxononanoate synthase
MMPEEFIEVKQSPSQNRQKPLHNSSLRHFRIFVTANDTGVGKTWVSALLVKELHGLGFDVAYTKPVETGCAEDVPRDAAYVKKINPEVVCTTGLHFKKPLAPLAAAEEENQRFTLQDVLDVIEFADPAQIRVIEGAGGISVPLDNDGNDWKTLVEQIEADVILVVVEDRLGAINQTRLVLHYLRDLECPVYVWLNRINNNEEHHNQKALEALKVPLVSTAREILQNGRKATSRFQQVETLEGRKQAGLLRELKVPDPNLVNLASNDYLGLARHPELIHAAKSAAEKYGTSSSASPLITGYQSIHRDLEQRVCHWHGFPSGLIWNSGFQANRSLLSHLPSKYDIILADRLIHRSLVAGCLQSGAMFHRYRHLDLDHLESLLCKFSNKLEPGAKIWVITESLFSMDGDVPDFVKLAQLKSRYAFISIVDEAHALGWYGKKGSGILEHTGNPEFVDILVGTFGKALASQGAYTLFRNPEYRQALVNFSEDFIYSTYLSPIAASVALKAVDLVEGMESQRDIWQRNSEEFRTNLRVHFPNVPDGTSPIIPIQPASSEATRELHKKLLAANILTGLIRPPTVPPGSSRLRVSLKADLDIQKLTDAFSIASKSEIEVINSKITWIGGWGIPSAWALEVLNQYYPNKRISWLPPTSANLQFGCFDGGYSLGASLLIRNKLVGNTELVAPFFDFKKEAGQGGKVARAQLLYIRKWLKKDPVAALNDFYQAADLPILINELPYSLDDLIWGIDQLLENVDLPQFPVSAKACWGQKDRLLNPEPLITYFSNSTVVPSATHNLDELFPKAQ